VKSTSREPGRAFCAVWVKIEKKARGVAKKQAVRKTLAMQLKVL
jgi:hypothetical protein